MSANVVSPVFIGRRDEIRSLERLLDRAQAGDAAFALIGGEAGGALLACGTAVVGYAALLLRGTDSPAPAPAPDQVLAG